jgi:hypothetical protein
MEVQIELGAGDLEEDETVAPVRSAKRKQQEGEPVDVVTEDKDQPPLPPPQGSAPAKKRRVVLPSYLLFANII